jgi:hypothetical protein
MIRYALACDNGHDFESWFPSSDAYDTQLARGLVACPLCHSAKVEKQIMTPSVARRDKAPSLPAVAPPVQPPISEAPAPQPMALLSEKEREVRAMLRAIREHVVQNAENVGERFSDEARKMHYGEIEHRSIYGAATLVEAKELLEEGIEVHPLPMIPDERN